MVMHGRPCLSFCFVIVIADCGLPVAVAPLDTGTTEDGQRHMNDLSIVHHSELDPRI
jgi:hypothetical protein